MTVDEFKAEVKKWLDSAKDPRWKRPYTELTYQPMQEVMQYLRANGYKTYIVTGGGQDFVRVYSEQVYGIPPEQVVGTAGGTIRLRQGRKTHPDQRAEAPAERRQCRQARRHPSDDRSAAVRSVRQLRPATSRCWSTPRLATGHGWRCWCCTTTPCASTPTARQVRQGRYVHRRAHGEAKRAVGSSSA